MKKRMLSWLVVLAFVVGTILPVSNVSAADYDGALRTASADIGCGAKVTLRVEGYGDNLIYPTTVTMPDTYKTLAEYGLAIGETDPGYFTTLHVLAQFCEDMGVEPSDFIDYYNGFLSNFMDAKGGASGATDTYFMYTVNNSVPADPVSGRGYGIGQCPVKNGDSMVLYDMWSDYPTASGSYAYFTEERKQAAAEEAFSMQMKTIDGMSGGAGNPKGAQILVLDESGAQVGADKASAGITESDGKASVMIQEPGTYIVTAERRSIYRDSNNNLAYDISRPYCKVTVKAGAALTDEEAVVNAKQVLSLGDISAVTENLTLPATGNNKTSITWESQDHSVLSDSGVLTRPIGEDKTVTLIATITKGSASEKKEFNITVKGYSLSLASLSVSAGALNFNKDIKEYTIYVKEEVSQINVTASTEEKGSNVMLKIQNETRYYDNHIGWTVPVVLTGDKTKITILVMKSGVSSETVINVKKAKNPGEVLPELPNEWGGHLGNADNNAAVTVQAATEGAKLKWENFSNAPAYFGSVYAGTPILVNGKLYAARNDKLEMIDTVTGKTLKSVDLLSGLGYYSYPAYGGGKIFVPLGDGSIQCFNAATLESLFVTQVPKDGQKDLQAMSSIQYADGMIYVGFTNGEWTDDKLAGYFAAYDTMDLDKDDTKEVITPEWTYGTASYYGAGSVKVDNYLVFAGDDGTVSAVDAKSGTVTGTLQIEGKVRSLPVYADGAVWIATQAGKLYKLTVDKTGALQKSAEVTLPATSNSSPVVTGGKVYITGGTFTGGFVAVYDSSLNLLSEAKTDAQANTPTVAANENGTYVYFTQNEPTGSLYVAKVTSNNQITVTKLFTPGHANYCMSKVVIGQDGTIYYYNDAGYIYALNSSGKTPDGGNQGKKEPAQEGTSTSNIKSLVGKADISRLRNRASKTALGNTASSGNAIENTSPSEQIAEVITERIQAGKMSLTVDNPPDVIEAEVFQAMKANPEFQLVLDCGNYTLSIRGADIKHENATLQTKLVEQESTISKEDAKKIGIHQQFAFVQEGELPGPVTVVYTLPEALKESKELYLYAAENLNHAKESIVQIPYAMFTLERGGTYLLAQQDVKGLTKTAAHQSNGETVSDSKAARTFPMGAWVFIGIAGVAVIIGGAFGTSALIKKKRRKRTWESEE